MSGVEKLPPKWRDVLLRYGVNVTAEPLEIAQGMFVRRADPHDGRRVFVELPPETSNALHRYFAEVERTAVI